MTECVSFRDNPWLPRELAEEESYLASVDPDAHAWVWLGHPRTASDAQVFKGKYVSEPFTPEPDWSGPYLGADWGFAQDPSALIRLWIHNRTLYVDHEAWGLGVDIDRLPALFDQVPDARRYTIRADSSRPETISYLRQHGYSLIRPALKWAGSVEDGIAHIRQYERIVVHPRCARLLEELRLYSYKIDRLTGDVLPEVVDRHNHLLDAMRYALQPLISSRQGMGALMYIEEHMAHASDVN
jgi:phage terminase large subunit